ncbi:MAG: hypothetical protein LBQ98_01455 [Nitrososphaerota archaeon]|jgi:hypothetical protein|nr:hypothetical protein [Nitrososphaerota archaeon]
MTSRLKTFGLIALIGFIAGVIAQAIITYVIPWMQDVLPSLAELGSFMIAGVAGAVVAVAIVGIWAYTSGRRDTY